MAGIMILSPRRQPGIVAAVLVGLTAALTSSPVSAQGDPFTDGVVKSADLDVKPKVVEKRVPSSAAIAGSVPAGSFIVEFIVERNGTVEHARPVGELGPYAEPLERARVLLRRWSFIPGSKGALPMRTLATLEVSFEPMTIGRRGGPGGASPRMTEQWSVDGVDDDFGAGAARQGDPGFVWPRVKRDVKPVYPRGVPSDTSAGTVELELVVLPTGRVGAARVTSSTDPQFEANALTAGRQWEFEPGQRQGQPAPVVVKLVLEFRRHGGASGA